MKEFQERIQRRIVHLSERMKTFADAENYNKADELQVRIAELEIVSRMCDGCSV